MKQSGRSASLFLLYCALAWSQTQSPPSMPESDLARPSAHAPEFAEARQLMERGKYDDALSQLKELEAKNRGLKGLSHELGNAYYVKGEYPKAAEYLKQALQEDSSDNEAVQLLGLSYYLAGRLGEAIPYLEKVQTWFPRVNVDAS